MVYGGPNRTRRPPLRPRPEGLGTSSDITSSVASGRPLVLLTGCSFCRIQQDSLRVPTSPAYNLKQLVGLTGLEPVTSSMSRKRANQLRYKPLYHSLRITYKANFSLRYRASPIILCSWLAMNPSENSTHYEELSEWFMVPGVGVEPTSPCGRWILSPVCLPISTSRQKFGGDDGICTHASRFCRPLPCYLGTSP